MNDRTIILLIALTIILNAHSFKNELVGNWERPVVEFPKDNPLTEASVELGGALFFEVLLSRDTSISCQSCHLRTDAFADHLPKGEGIKGRHVERNTPTLLNIGFHPYLMIDGKFNTLEEQVLAPIKEHNEFDMTPQLVVERLQSIPAYNEMSKAAYQEELSIRVIQKAIANFERILISDNSKFDKFMRKETSLSTQEMKGWELFKSPDLKCIQCHNGYNFTNYKFENNGLYTEYKDKGRSLITGDLKDLAKFKVPTLRNIALTYPYMHNGSMATLEEVIDHYASGGTNHKSQSKHINGFEISSDERSFLIAFLKTLTDESLLGND